MTTECLPRFSTARTPERATLGRAAAKIARVLGQPLMPWQRRVLDTALEVDASGALAYGDVVLTVPRQQGKSYLLLVLMLTRALLEPRQNVVYTAQSGLDARKKWSDDWLPMVRASRFASQVSAYQAPGRESFRFSNGSRQSIVASTAKSGHGMVVDLGVMDEAFSYQDARTEQALRPAMMTRPGAQLWVVSTAGTPHGSPYLLERVQRGRQAVEADISEGLCYCEWSAADELDPADPATWRSCMPALGHTVGEDVVRAAFLSMARHEFERAYLNRWTSSAGDPIVSLEVWQALAEPDAARPEWVALGVDIAPRGKSAAIAAVGERDGLLYGSILEYGPGTDWLVSALERLAAEGRPYVVLDEKSVAHLMPEIRFAVGSDRVIALGAREVPAACEFWLRLVNEGTLRHRGERELVVALDGAGQRSLGDGWAWSRAKSGTDITPLAALTWAAEFFRGSWGVL